MMQITKTMYGGYFGNDPVPRLVETSTYANDGGTSAPICILEDVLSRLYDKPCHIAFSIKDTDATRNFFDKISKKSSLDKEELDYFYKHSTRCTVDGKLLVDGQLLFDSMDSCGIPLDVQLMQLDIISNENFAVDWPRFIDRALERNWLVYQIHDKIKYSLRDSDVFDSEYIESVMNLFRIYICSTVDSFKQFLKVSQ